MKLICLYLQAFWKADANNDADTLMSAGILESRLPKSELLCSLQPAFQICQQSVISFHAHKSTCTAHRYLDETVNTNTIQPGHTRINYGLWLGAKEL